MYQQNLEEKLLKKIKTVIAIGFFASILSSSLIAETVILKFHSFPPMPANSNAKFVKPWGDKIEKDSVIVDAFLHANEKLYDFNDINSLMKKSGLFGYSIFGITTKTQGLLFSTKTDLRQKLKTSYTDMSKIFSSKITLEYYNLLDIEDKCRIIELFYEPNGYTIIGLTKNMYNSLDSKSRIKNNFIKC